MKGHSQVSGSCACSVGPKQDASFNLAPLYLILLTLISALTTRTRQAWGAPPRRPGVSDSASESTAVKWDARLLVRHPRHRPVQWAVSPDTAGFLSGFPGRCLVFTKRPGHHSSLPVLHAPCAPLTRPCRCF